MHQLAVTIIIQGTTIISEFLLLKIFFCDENFFMKIVNLY